jgi:hypothetical protein
MGLDFYLGTHMPDWLYKVTFPLFVSHRRLAKRKTPFPGESTCRWALDSGGFSELNMYDGWRTTRAEYIDAVRQYQDQIGNLDWASPQDWMCEPPVIAKTGLFVVDHLHRTVDNFAALREEAPDLPFIPVIQGWELDDYFHCMELYEEAGIDLTTFPTVGLGSTCRRQHTDEIGRNVKELTNAGLSLHGFGMKLKGIAKYGEFLTSADSMSWSYQARRNERLPGCSGHLKCNNCLRYATQWREKVLNVCR